MTRQDARTARLLCCLALLLGPGAVDAADPASTTLRLSVRQSWVDTGLDVQAGEALHVEAEGQARMERLAFSDYLFGAEFDRTVGPRGTYLWRRHRRRRAPAPLRQFPLPAMEAGPYPAYGLIGKIGEEGVPFYLGEQYTDTVADSGRLWIGVNDDTVRDNRGYFEVRIRLDAPRSSDAPDVIAAPIAAGSGQPVPKARVLLVYIDGLRADVVHEMAAAGFLPTMQRRLLEGGLECVNAFTGFPSNTLITNGALFTGRWSDRTGIKSQNQFERSTLKPTGQLSEWLPDWLSMRVVPQTQVINLLDKFAPEHTYTFLRRRGVPTLGSRLGSAYLYTILPISPLNPPPQWFHRAMNTIANPFGAATRIPSALDTINAQFAIEELIGIPEARVIAVWLPMVDKVSHSSPRGQFGGARRDLALADRLLGAMLSRMRQVGWEDSTYLIVVSDHGHLGGEQTVNRRANLPRDWAHRQLGCNVRVVGDEWQHPGLDPDRFIFFDHQMAGQAKLFLPKASYHYGPWRRNSLYELTHYRLGPGRSVNLLHSLAAFRGPEWTPAMPAPVDLVLVKLDAERVFIYRTDDNQALLHLERDAEGREVFRYEPVRRLRQAEDGTIQYESPLPGQDPLGYLGDPSVREHLPKAQWVEHAYPADRWLTATARSRYPDAVVAIAKFFSWRLPVEDLAEVRDPDLVVTAQEGWSFRSDDAWGTDHGALLAEAMRITLFLAGPNIRPGRLEAPQRIINVLPTILEMIGQPYDPQTMDGRAIRGIYE